MIYSNYTGDDLEKTMDVLAFVRSRREKYIPDGVDIGHFLAGRMMFDLVFLNCIPSSVSREGEWWLIESAKDWINEADPIKIREVFNRIVSLPAAGQNSFRSEVLIHAFASSVITCDGQNGILEIRGNSAAPIALKAGRVLAFLV